MTSKTRNKDIESVFWMIALWHCRLGKIDLPAGYIWESLYCTCSRVLAIDITRSLNNMLANRFMLLVSAHGGCHAQLHVSRKCEEMSMATTQN